MSEQQNQEGEKREIKGPPPESFKRVFKNQLQILDQIHEVLQGNEENIDEYVLQNLYSDRLPIRFVTSSRGKKKIFLEGLLPHNSPHRVLAKFLALPHDFNSLTEFEQEIFLEKAFHCSYQGLEGNDFLFEARERIFVDQVNDSVLKNAIAEFQERMSSISGNNVAVQAAEALYDFLRYFCFQKYPLPMGTTDSNEYPFGGIKPVWELGKVIQTGCSMCRHVQLLGKIIGDNCGVKLSLQRGSILGYEKLGSELKGPHAWLICHIDNVPHLLDPTLDHEKIRNIQYSSDDGQMNISADKGKKLYTPEDFS